MSNFRVTYEIVTQESAEQGDFEEAGFLLAGEWRVPVGTNDDDVSMSLREAMRLCYPQEDCGGWWTEVDGRQDFRTGSHETRAIHPPANITAASYARVSRLLSITRA